MGNLKNFAKFFEPNKALGVVGQMGRQRGMRPAGGVAVTVAQAQAQGACVTVTSHPRATVNKSTFGKKKKIKRNQVLWAAPRCLTRKEQTEQG